MEKQEVKSKWDELARQLGADVSPEAEQLVEAAAPAPEETPSPTIESSIDVSRLPTPKRRAAGWDSLANEFGLPTPPPLDEPVTDSPARVIEERVIEENLVIEEIVSRRPRREETARREERPPREERGRRDERPRREERARRDERPRREEKPGREEKQQREEKPRRERNRDDQEPSGRRRPSRHVEREDEPIERPAPIDVVEADVVEAQSEETQVSPPAAAPEERASRGAAVSLWHKIFGSPVDQTAKLSDISSAGGETEQASQFTEDVPERREMDLREHASMSDADQQERQDFDQRDEDSGDADDVAISDQKRRRRRGRRRRGGREERPAGKEVSEHRRRRPEVTHADREDDEQIDDLTTDDDELDSEIGTDDDMADASDVDANGESTGVASRSRSALQRSIPSWDEAIGFIVESNMQTRSQRRPSSHSGPRSHSPRGRGRGRRKN